MDNIILYKLSSKKEDNSSRLIQEFLRCMLDKNGYKKVYMSYGKEGRGFYYIKEDYI